jgi:membrane AbrB-like protein
MRTRSTFIAWCCLLALTALFVPLLVAARLPAAFLLGPLAAAIVLGSADARIVIVKPLLLAAQAVIGCMIARALELPILAALSQHWALFVGAVGAVLIVSILMGLLLMRLRVLPGTTAIWGSFPGAAMVMTLMAEAYGEDVRLVAFMQYLRVVCVAAGASLFARLYLGSAGAASPVWFSPIAWPALLNTLAVGAACAWLGARTRLPVGALLLPMLVCTVLQDAGLITIELPSWLLALSYALIGWSIGLRFTRDILSHAARALPRVLTAILLLMGCCVGLGFALSAVSGIDLLTALLATSPGGADSIAIIAASSHVDLPFVVAMQTARFILVLLAGPVLARLLARWTSPRKEPA